MEIHARSVKSALFLTVALCGEVRRKDLANICGSPITCRRVIGELINEGLLHEAKLASQRVRVLRLKMPKAQEVLEQMPKLAFHYQLVSNGHLFKEFPRSLSERALKMSEACQKMIAGKIQIDGIKLCFELARGRKETCDYVKAENISKESRSILSATFIYDDEVSNNLEASFESTLKDAIDYEPGFIISQLVKKSGYKEAKESITNKINASRSVGFLFGNKNAYAVYHGALHETRESGATEERLRHLLQASARSLFGPEAYAEMEKASPRGECLLLGMNEELIKNALDEGNKLTAIYSRCYVVKDNIGMYVEENWKENLLKKLFTTPQIMEAQRTGSWWLDAVVDDVATIELISMDLGKMKLTRDLMLKNDKLTLRIVCEEKDKEMIESLYEGLMDRIKISF